MEILSRCACIVIAIFAGASCATTTAGVMPCSPNWTPTYNGESVESVDKMLTDATKDQISPIHRSGSLPLGKLLSIGDALRDRNFMVRDMRLVRAAEDCYVRALSLKPDDYRANFGLGITHLMHAYDELTDVTQEEAHLSAAKRLLGKAYALGHGYYEPLYYIAEIAVYEEKYSLAASYFKSLEQLGVRRGEVTTLLGYLAEKRKDRDAAIQYYRTASDIGWPTSSIVFAVSRLQQIGR